MTHDDVLFRYRLRLFALADELRPRERRPPQSPRRTPPWLEQHILALALAHPG